MNDLLLESLAEFYDHGWFRPELRDYLNEHKIDLGRVLPHIGAIGMMDVTEFDGDRFDFTGPGERITCVVFEAIDETGEEAFDLVALPVGEPQRPMSMFGRVGLLNPFALFWRGSYCMGKSVPVHRDPLLWLKSGCTGTAMIHPHRAAHDMLDVPGQLLGQDGEHCGELAAIARSVVDDRLFVMPAPRGDRRAA